MKSKQWILMLVLAFCIGTTAFAKDAFIPQVQVFIQPKNGQAFNVNEFKTLKIGEEYILNIYLYIKTTDMFLYKKEIDSSIAFYDPAIDIYSYSSIRNLKMDPIYNFIIADFMTPVSKTTPKDDHTDHYQLSFLFTPRLTGTQDITIFFHDIEDPKYQKHSFSLHFED